MKFVGVISGGKDSILAIHLAVAEGHELVCLANLHPPDRSSELDSYMYQCAGTEIVEAIGEAFQLPLLRRPMNGQPIAIHSNSYEQTEGDEVEDLYLLLQDCKQRFPEIEAITTGAVFSNYQKQRVENCCKRLGIVSMAPLWLMAQDRVLDLVEEFEIEAILVKTAFVGLDKTHVGKTTRELRPVFRKLAKELGFNECGEGGEFESIVLDCPLMSRKRVEIIEPRAVKHGRDCWLLKCSGARAVSKAQ
jgi:diphthine-ammonia ligase